MTPRRFFTVPTVPRTINPTTPGDEENLRQFRRQAQDLTAWLQGTRNGPIQNLLDSTPDMLNVRSLGAKGDGTTDDLPAIQQAIDDMAESAPTVGGGNIVWFDPGRYLIDGTIVRKHGVHLMGAGILNTTISLADGANVPMLKDENFDAIEASPTSSTLIVNGIIQGFTFFGNRPNQTGDTSGGLFLAEGGGYYDQIHIIEIDGPGWKRVGSRVNGGNFPQYDDSLWKSNVVTRVGLLSIAQTDGIGIHELGTNDAWYQMLFMGGSQVEGLVVDGASFLQVDYAHIFNNNKANGTDYQVRLESGGVDFGHLAIRDGEESALEASTVMQCRRLTCRNNRQVGTNAKPVVHLKASNARILDFEVSSENANGASPWASPFLQIGASGSQVHRCYVRMRYNGNDSGTDIADYAVAVFGDSNVIEGDINYATTAVDHNEGEMCEYDVFVKNCTNAMERGETNLGGRTIIRYDTDDVTNVLKAGATAFAEEEHCWVSGDGSTAEKPSENTVGSGDIDANAGVGTQTTNVAHGLFATPASVACVTVTPVVPSGTASTTWAGYTYVDSVDATNVVLKTVTTTNGAAGDKIAYEVRAAVTARPG